MAVSWGRIGALHLFHPVHLYALDEVALAAEELYKHEHFLDVQSVEIVPYRKNKSILLVNFKLKLYAKK